MFHNNQDTIYQVFQTGANHQYSKPFGQLLIKH
jgi:hypothetical protein